MSNALAIATVTQALALLLENNLRPEIDMAVSVETRRPPAEPPTEPTLTVFLYQVTPNASLRNSDLPTRASDGTLLKRPAAPLDLHFLISAFGEETELVGQRLLGTVIRTLHEIPVLPRELIEEAARRPYLAGSDLADAIQKVRFTPTQMDVDETSKLWGMLYQTPYALSVCYQAALVLIDGREKPVPAKPVERPEVHVYPFGAPGAPEVPEAAEGSEAADGSRVADGGPAGREAPDGTPDSGRTAGGKAVGRKDRDGKPQDGKAAGASRGRAAGTSTRAARKAAAGVGGAGTRAAKKPATGQGQEQGQAQRKAAKPASAPARSDADGTPGAGPAQDTGTDSGTGKEG
ncbi:DUF4255 domain-containing protein [Streptomyces pinistramenti]|uniref:DUF4255 domain-containing protein n=1 Tax=Streptomyces pinistramenti TaxID=2884812 RepID=UPI001D07F7B4|nr:DUF4255 domain-containing protein [Streptomyces pinistramenti]MCB5911737.1 DUF4255 domain-containing protein [Streptomyces pinistramenti]